MQFRIIIVIQYEFPLSPLLLVPCTLVTCKPLIQHGMISTTVTLLLLLRYNNNNPLNGDLQTGQVLSYFLSYNVRNNASVTTSITGLEQPEIPETAVLGVNKCDVKNEDESNEMRQCVKKLKKVLMRNEKFCDCESMK